MAGSGKLTVVFASEERLSSWPDIKGMPAASSTGLAEQGTRLPQPRLPSPTDASVSAYEFTVSLRIRHPTIDPAQITAALAIGPQHTWRAGEPRCDAVGAELGGVHHDSYWMGRLMDGPQLSSDSVSVERVILLTLSHLRRAQSFLEELNAEGGVAELLVSLYAREDFRLELPSDSLTLLGRMHLSIALDVHPHPSQKAPMSRSN